MGKGKGSEKHNKKGVVLNSYYVTNRQHQWRRRKGRARCHLGFGPQKKKRGGDDSNLTFQGRFCEKKGKKKNQAEI